MTVKWTSKWSNEQIRIWFLFHLAKCYCKYSNWNEIDINWNDRNNFLNENQAKLERVPNSIICNTVNFVIHNIKMQQSCKTQISRRFMTLLSLSMIIPKKKCLLLNVKKQKKKYRKQSNSRVIFLKHFKFILKQRKSSNGGTYVVLKIIKWFTELEPKNKYFCYVPDIRHPLFTHLPFSLLRI